MARRGAAGAGRAGDMNPFATRLAARLAAAGPISVAEYMAASLADPAHGYYRGADPLGVQGDFTTSPEISQLFGELIGAWLIDCWNRIGRPNPVRLVELGPGRGTLMQDALRIGGLVPDWLSAIELHLVEINPTLRRLQAERLSPYRPQWHESLGAIPDGPLLLVANEFLDALPIRQLVFSEKAWRERLVGWNAEQGFHFTLATAPSPLGALIPAALPDICEGAIFELSPAAIGVTAEITRRIARFGGASLLVDYGRVDAGLGETLQAVKRHRTVGIFDDPGAADLSAHVDFSALHRASSEAGAMRFGPITQRDYLTALGIHLRVARLRPRVDRSEALKIDDAVARLVGSDAMGTLFKVLAIAQPGMIPAGFPPEANINPR